MNNETNGYIHDLNMLLILHWLHVSYSRRSVCKLQRICHGPTCLRVMFSLIYKIVTKFNTIYYKEIDHHTYVHDSGDGIHVIYV